MGSNLRRGKPKEIAQVAWFFGLSAPRFVNGTVLTADGGRLAY